MVDLTWPSPISNLTTTEMIDTDVKNTDDSQYVSTPRKKITVILNYMIQII